MAIELNVDVIKTADWIIDMGPEGGVRGGEIVAEGMSEQVAKVARAKVDTSKCQIGALNGRKLSISTDTLFHISSISTNSESLDSHSGLTILTKATRSYIRVSSSSARLKTLYEYKARKASRSG